MTRSILLPPKSSFFTRTRGRGYDGSSLRHSCASNSSSSSYDNISDVDSLIILSKEDEKISSDTVPAFISINKTLQIRDHGSKIGILSRNGISTELMISLLSGFMLCAIFDVTLYRSKILPEIGFLGFFVHDHYVPINVCMLAYTYISYLYRCTIPKVQKYVVRESYSIPIGDAMYNALLALPDICTLGLTCFVTTRQVYLAFHLLVFSALLLSVMVTCLDYGIHRIKKITQQQDIAKSIDRSISSSSSVPQKNRKKATRTLVIHTETSLVTALGTNSTCLWCSVV